MSESFLGTGWSFPPEFIKKSRTVAMSSDEKDIKESIGIILTTRLGERVMEPRFGSNIGELLFKPMDLTLLTDLRNRIREALLYFESRIDVISVDFNTDDYEDGILVVAIDFSVRSTNSRMNMVYPFYSIEGTNI